MHNFETLAADLAPLLKRSGDSGDSGDKFKFRRPGNDLGVTTQRVSASPPTNQVVTSSKSSGDVKRYIFQSFNKGVTAVTSVTTNLDNGEAHRPGANTAPELRADLNTGLGLCRTFAGRDSLYSHLDQTLT
jgi:hypothetical protein